MVIKKKCSLIPLLLLIVLGCSDKESISQIPGVRDGVGNLHVSPETPPKDPYTSIPATSGWHYGHPYAPAPWGIYDQELPDEVLVHNLEHGGIGIHYDCPNGCDEIITVLIKIASIYLASDDPQHKKIIVSPYPNMNAQISLTSWLYLQTFSKIDNTISNDDESQIHEFIETHMSSTVAPEWRAR